MWTPCSDARVESTLFNSFNKAGLPCSLALKKAIVKNATRVDTIVDAHFNLPSKLRSSPRHASKPSINGKYMKTKVSWVSTASMQSGGTRKKYNFLHLSVIHVVASIMETM